MGDECVRRSGIQLRRRSVGEVLLTEFLWAEKNYAEVLAASTGLPLSTAEAILHDEATIDDEIAARLAAAFMTNARYWMDLQTGGAGRRCAQCNDKDCTMPPELTHSFL